MATRSHMVLVQQAQWEARSSLPTVSAKVLGLTLTDLGLGLFLNTLRTAAGAAMLSLDRVSFTSE